MALKNLDLASRGGLRHPTRPVTASNTLTQFGPSGVRYIQWFYVMGYGVKFLLCCILIYHMRHNRSVALTGDASAARKVLLPSFEPLLWILGGAIGIYTIFFCVSLAAKFYPGDFPLLISELFYCGRQFVFLVVVVFMFRKSVSRYALWRSVVISLLLATYTIPIIAYAQHYANTLDIYLVRTFSRLPILIVYAYIFTRPPGRASKQSFREYGIYVAIYFVLLFSQAEVFRQQKRELGIVLTFTTLLWGALCPLVIWRLLRADTEYWRGVGQRACAIPSLFRQQHNIIDEYVSSQGFHFLIEMHRSFLIDFAYLKINQRIGDGATAVVFNGSLYSKTPVAVKVYVPAQFDEDTIAEFSHEAALCSSLDHPNIVKFYGLCVNPPMICLVSELCQGSLEDMMATIEHHEKHANRKQLLIDIAYMLDAARAVAYLHSFSPSFLHRDIKPANLLVDAENNVKLTDFGESRSLPSLDEELAQVSRTSLAGRGSGDAFPAAGTSDRPMSIHGTVDYMAPEIINGCGGSATYGDAADVYSLAITMWDILHPGVEKFPLAQNNHMIVFQHVIDGDRPTFTKSVPAALRNLIENAWQLNSCQRPSAQDIVRVLESIQEENHALLVLELHKVMRPSCSANMTVAPIDCCFTGAQVIALMTSLGHVATSSEGIRMGNAFMDAGLLHHVHHSCGFENSDAVYYFDQENLQLVESVQVFDTESPAVSFGSETLSRGSTSVSNGGKLATWSSACTPRQRNRHGLSTASRSRCESYFSSSLSTESVLEPLDLCSCRKLGQRLKNPKPSRKRSSRRKRLSSQELDVEKSLSINLLSAEEVDNAIWNEFDNLH